ncbi:hypothetical protein [Deinococcus sp.]|uniref:hypothetical protein n=1 Tax=Deinococcus sp. TaxID=47478 RepID=UPI003C7AC84D
MLWCKVITVLSVSLVPEDQAPAHTVLLCFQEDGNNTHIPVLLARTARLATLGRFYRR